MHRADDDDHPIIPVFTRKENSEISKSQATFTQTSQHTSLSGDQTTFSLITDRYSLPFMRISAD